MIKPVLITFLIPDFFKLQSCGAWFSFHANDITFFVAFQILPWNDYYYFFR